MFVTQLCQQVNIELNRLVNRLNLLLCLDKHSTQVHTVKMAGNAHIAGLHQQACQKYTSWHKAQAVVDATSGQCAVDTEVLKFGLIIFQ